MGVERAGWRQWGTNFLLTSGCDGASNPRLISVFVMHGIISAVADYTHLTRLSLLLPKEIHSFLNTFHADYMLPTVAFTYS